MSTLQPKHWSTPNTVQRALLSAKIAIYDETGNVIKTTSIEARTQDQLERRAQSLAHLNAAASWAFI